MGDLLVLLKNDTGISLNFDGDIEDLQCQIGKKMVEEHNLKHYENVHLLDIVYFFTRNDFEITKVTKTIRDVYQLHLIKKMFY